MKGDIVEYKHLTLLVKRSLISTDFSQVFNCVSVHLYNCLVMLYNETLDCDWGIVDCSPNNETISIT